MSHSTAVASKPAQDIAGNDFAVVNTSQLREAVRLHFPVYDSRGVLLLAAGAVVTAGIIERLIRRGVTTIRVHKADLARVCKPAGSAPARISTAKAAPSPGRGKPAARAVVSQATSASPADTLAQLKNELMSDVSDASNPEGAALPDGDKAEPDATVELPEIVDTARAGSTPHGAVPYDQQLLQEFASRQQESLDHIERMFRTMHEVRRGDVESLECVSSDALMRMVQDTDLFVLLGITPGADKYPARHSVQSAMLAMAVATNMGLEKRSVVELGVGCLTHDVGMLQMRVPVFQQDGTLDPVSFLEITKHPSYTFDLMRSVEQLAGCSRLVAYQMHERCDGSGYPRRRRDSQIHPLAKIAAVADVFVALISPRSYRPPVLPYFAMEYLLRGVKQGKFDSHAVRALLHTVSLFPIGSCVELNDGRAGRVLRSNGQNFTRPVLELCDPRQPETTTGLVDLTQETGINIIRPLVDLGDASGQK